MIRPSSRISGQLETADRLKTQLVANILDAVDVSKAAEIGATRFRAQVRALVDHLCTLNSIDLDADVREAAAARVMDEICGFGPITKLVDDPLVSEILIQVTRPAVVRRGERIETTDVRFADAADLLRFIEKLLARKGHRITADDPLPSIALDDGWHMAAVVEPLASQGPVLTLKRSNREWPTLSELTSRRMLAPEMAEFLAAAVAGRLNVLITGPSGSGKTALLNALGAYIPEQERIVVIEDVAQLKLGKPNVIAVETWANQTVSDGASRRCRLLRSDALVRSARVLIDPLRSAETGAVLQAAVSGGEGTIMTLPAADAMQALNRLELFMQLNGPGWSTSAVQRFLCSAVDLLVQITRFPSGEQRVSRVAELSPNRDRAGGLSDVFVFRSTGCDAAGRLEGVFYATGCVPKSARRLAAAGQALPAGLFHAAQLMR